MSRIFFQKKPVGWDVAITRFNGDSESTAFNGLFWTKEKKNYLQLDLPAVKDKDENRRAIEEAVNSYLKNWYKVFPYYGYNGWDRDVIGLLEKEKQLSDTDLYALGRAYSSVASNFLSYNEGFMGPENKFSLPEGPNSMTSEQLAEYRRYRHLAIASFRKLMKQNSEFETIVGRIDMKTGNEHMTSFLDLRMYQNEDEANKELADSIYSPFMISCARNYLNSCEKNAVLWTNGDNDTYPLLYVQSRLGFRKDVLVVNLSLLNLSRYVNNFRSSILDAPPIEFMTTPEEIKNDLRDYLPVQEEKNEYTELSDLIAFQKQKEHTIAIGTKALPYFPSKKIQLTCADGSKMKWKLEKEYLLRSELIVLDMLAVYACKRPLYMAVTCAPESYLGMQKYFRQEGLAYRITSHTEGSDPYIDTGILYDRLMNSFAWDGKDAIAQHDKFFCSAYLRVLGDLAGALIRENKKDSALAVLEKASGLFPEKKYRTDEFFIPLMESYYLLGRNEKAEAIFLKLLYNIKNRIDNYYDIKDVSPGDTKSAILTKLLDISDRYEPRLSKEVRSLNEH